MSLISKNPEELESHAIKAIEAGDLFAMTAKVLAHTISRTVIKDESFLAKDDDIKEIILFKAIFQSLRMMREAEDRYDQQFKTEEK